MRTKWSSNQFSLGSYSFVKTGSSIRDCKTLSQPLDRLFFAGEASNAKYIATVHGAYISGRETANKISKNIKD